MFRVFTAPSIHSIVARRHSIRIPFSRAPLRTRHSSRPAGPQPAAAQLETMVSASQDRQSAAIKGLKPEPLWHFFDGLSQLPRPSKHEDKCDLESRITDAEISGGLIYSCIAYRAMCIYFSKLDLSASGPWPKG